MFYTYFVRDFSIASLNLLLGLVFVVFGLLFGMWEWIASIRSGVPATTGTVMLAVLPIVVGVQMLLFFLGYDMQNEPRKPLQTRKMATSLEASYEWLRERAGSR